MSDRLEAGRNFFNDGHYFEAHEAWEEVWRQTRGPLRLFYQGLVQAAVGLHHLAQGNMNGARSQLEKSISKLEQYPDKFCGLDNLKLTADLRHILSELRPQLICVDRV